MSSDSAALLSIGTELTRGELVDTNANWLSAELTAMGLTVRERATVADSVVDISSALVRLAKHASVVIVTGGLGPTSDDLTAAGAAQAAGVSIVRHERAFTELKRRYEARGLPLTELRASQADYPDGAGLLDNSVGTAFGFHLMISGTPCYFMPGVPKEMYSIFRTQVQPRLPSPGVTSHQVHLRTFGLPEAEIAGRLEHMPEQVSASAITFGYRVSQPEVEVKILAQADSEAVARADAVAKATAVRDTLGEVVYGEHDDSFEAIVGESLRHHGLTLGLAESCTGGMIGSMLTEVPGSSAFFLLDAVVYSNAMKTRVLGVDPDTLRAHGAVSEACARAMAAGVRRVADSDLGLAITGIAGPSGGSPERPVGTVWFALACADQIFTAQHRFNGDREQIRRVASYVGLDMIRRFAEGHDVSAVLPHTQEKRT